MTEVEKLRKYIERLENALRRSPMPIRESVLESDEWDEGYDYWWHKYSSEDAIAEMMPKEEQRFRKKPVVIEARQLTEESLDEVAWWCGGTPRTRLARDAGLSWLVIETLEGDMHAEESDWIIRGVKGEFYPCKPDIFDATYEPATEEKP